MAPATAVLCSGGIDSAVLLGELAKESPRVVPIYVRVGMRWEQEELAGLERFLSALNRPNVDAPVVFDLPIAPVYGRHWSVAGPDAVPASDSTDEAVYLPGRNLLLLAQPSVWCRLNGVATIAIGTLAGNPFLDATADFFANFADLARQAMGGELQIICPLRKMSKREVLLLGRDYPLKWTVSCLMPAAGLHCGRCNKCEERKLAFADAKLPDPTRYADVGP